MGLFSPYRALRLARYVGRAYEGTLPEMHLIRETQTEFGLVSDEDYTVLAFPGTASRKDVVTDLRCLKLPWNHAGRVHAGFRAAFDSAWEEIACCVPKARPVIVTGHSLGGALAMLAAYALRLHGVNIHSVVTFGSPRVGNWGFARKYNSCAVAAVVKPQAGEEGTAFSQTQLPPELGEITWRVVNHRDPVPHIPWQLGTYRHAGREVFMPEDGPLLVDRGWMSLAAEKVELLSDGAEHRQFLRASAHSLQAYIARLSHA